METKKPQLLSREEMHAILDRGESIMMPNGRICREKHELPSEGEMALRAGDEERQAAAVEDLQDKIEKLQASLAQLQSSQAPGPQGPTRTASTEDDQAPKGPVKTGSGAADAATEEAANARERQAAEQEAEKARERQALLTGGPAQPPAPTQEAKPESTQGSLLPGAPAGPAKPADKGGKK